MTATRTPNPSPLAGEGDARTRSVRAAGEGSGGAVDLGACRLPRALTRPLAALAAVLSRKGRGEEQRRALQMRRRARALRARMTDAERKLWFALRDRRFAGFKFRRKFRSIASSRILFVSKRAWSSKWTAASTPIRVQDRRRDRWFAANGFRVVRFWNNEVLSNLEGVLTVLSAKLEQCR